METSAKGHQGNKKKKDFVPHQRTVSIRPTKPYHARQREDPAPNHGDYTDGGGQQLRVSSNYDNSYQASSLHDNSHRNNQDYGAMYANDSLGVPSHNAHTSQQNSSSSDQKHHTNASKQQIATVFSQKPIPAQSKQKIPLRRCASVDVAELHRKKKRSHKKKVEKELSVPVPKTEQIPMQLLKNDASVTHPQRSGSLGRRPESLKLLDISKSNSTAFKPVKNQNTFPTPTPPSKHVNKTVEQPVSSNSVSSKPEMYDTRQNVPLTQRDRSRKVTVDLSDIDVSDSDFPAGEGYRRHGLKHNFPSSKYMRVKPPVVRSIGVQILGTLLYGILAFFVFCPFVAVFLVVFPVCYLLKFLCKFCCCCCTAAQGENCVCCMCGEKLQSTEKFWILNERESPKVVQSFVVLEYGLSAPQIVNLINTRLVLATSDTGDRLYPRFSQKVVRTCSDYIWAKDNNFFIHNHVFTMPKGIESLEDLQDYVSDMASKPLSFDIPLWEVHVLMNFGDQCDTVLLFRMHPCLCDGVSLVKILYKSIADVDSVTTVPPRFAQQDCVDSIKSIFFGPLMLLQRFIFSRSDFNLLHGKHTHLSGKKVIAWSDPFSLSSAIRIKQVTRSTLNEVLMSVASGCIRNFLKLSGIPNPFNMKCSIPVSFETDRMTASTCNNVIMLNVSLPTNTEGMVPRLWQMKEHMIEVHQSAVFPLTRKLFKITYHMLPECLWLRFWRGVVNQCTCTVASLPGPEISLRLASKQIKTVFYWFPHIHQVALSVSFFTYGDHIHMAVSSDRAVLPNPEILTNDFIHQLQMLSEQLASRRIPGEHLNRKVDMRLLNNEIKPEETAEEIQQKMSMVHQELQNLKHQLDSNKFHHSDHEHKISRRIEALKEQFRELLVEMRQRKAAEREMAISVNDDDSMDDDEFDLPRRPFRRRAMSVSSRMSTMSVMSTVRPLIATNTPAITPDFSPDSPLISDKQVPYASYSEEQKLRPYSTYRSTSRNAREDFEILEYQYSPSLERRYKVKH